MSILFAFTQVAFAHPEGFSGLRVEVLADRIQVSLTVHTRDMSNWFPPGKYPDYVPQVMAAMSASPGDALEIHLDDQPIPATNPRATLIDVGLIQLELDFSRPSTAKTLQVWSKHLGYFPRGHEQLLFIDHDGQTLLEDTLTSDHDSAEVDLPIAIASTLPASPAPPPKRISFFLLGIEHIVTGYDHLLFLAALLLVCKNFREAAGVITFFTIAHSITLTLAALDIVRLPGRIVEPAIAASIIYVGLENIFGRHQFIWRAMVTFGFGLVHGLGFASALREVGLGSTNVGVAMPLLKFSVGLETGQLCIAAVLLSLLLTLRHKPAYERRWAPAGSVLVSLIGGYWLVTRLLAG